MSADLPERGWQGYGAPGHKYATKQTFVQRMTHEWNVMGSWRERDIKSMQDQASTRRCPFPTTVEGAELYGRIEDIGMRREFGGVGR